MSPRTHPLFAAVLLACLSVVALGGESTGPGWRLLLAGKLDAAAEAFRGPGPEAGYGQVTIAIEKGRWSTACKRLQQELADGAWSFWHEMMLLDAMQLLEHLDDCAPLEATLAGRLGNPACTALEACLLQEALRTLHLRQGRIKPESNRHGCARIPDRMQTLGPFENRDGARFAEPLLKEDTSLSWQEKQVWQGRTCAVGWQSVPVPPSGEVKLREIWHPGREVTGYAAVALDVQERTRDLTFVFGGEGALFAWLDGQPLVADSLYTSGSTLMRMAGRSLKKGLHVLVCKIGADRVQSPALALRVLPVAIQTLNQPGSAQKAQDPGFRFVPVPHSYAAPAPEKGEAGPGLDWGAAILSDKELPPALVETLRAYLHLVRGTDDRHWSRARPLLESALEGAPASSMVLALAAQVQPDDNRKQALLKKAMNSSATCLAAAELYLDALMEAGFLQEAEPLARQLAAQSARAADAMAAIFEARQWRGEARRWWLRSLQLAPGRPETYLHLSWKATPPFERREWLRKGLQKTGSFRLQDKLIRDALKRKDYESAQTMLTAGLAVRPESLSLWLQQMDCARAEGDLDGEEKALRKALVWLPQSPTLLKRAGDFYLDQKDASKGLSCLRKSLSFRPEQPKLIDQVRLLAGEETAFYSPYAYALEELMKKPCRPQAYPQHNQVGLLDQVVIEVKPNGTRQKMVRTVGQVLRPRAVRRLSVRSVSYDSTRQRVRVIHARVHQPDGVVEEQAQLKKRAYRGRQSGNIYGSYTTLSITLPNVRVGSVVDVQYVLEDTAPNLYSDQFETGYYFGSVFPVRQFDFTVIAPGAMTLQSGQALTGVHAVRRALPGARQELRWRTEDLAGVELEPFMPPYSEYVPSLRVTSFRDWNHVGQWYRELAQEQMHLPDEIREEVLALVEGVEEREARIRLVYDWITEHIRYVSISFGLFGCKPHKAERTWRSRYGDCKDTAVLFCAMLKVLGIDCQLVLVRTFDKGGEPTGIPGARLFNHAIAYVPPLQAGAKAYWLDGTTDFYRFGELPEMDRGAMALRITKEGGRLTRIDNTYGDASAVVHKGRIVLDKEGNGAVSFEEVFHGAMAPGVRRMQEKPDLLKRRFRQMLQARFPGMELKDLVLKSKEQPSMGLSLHIPVLAKQQNQVGRLRPFLFSQAYSQQWAAQEERRFDLLTGTAFARRYVLDVALPVGAKVIQKPKDMENHIPFGSYARRVEVKGNRVRLELNIAVKVRRIPAAGYGTWKDFCNEVDSLFDDWLVYELE